MTAVTGNKVLFVGGPEAGNVRLVPESEGDMLKAGGTEDYYYKIWPMKMAGSTDVLYFAYVANQHPMRMLLDMWREYAPTAQILRKGVEASTYNNVKPQ